MKALEYLFNNPAKCTAVVFGGMLLTSTVFVEPETDFNIVPAAMQETARIESETEPFVVQAETEANIYVPEVIKCHRPGIDYITMQEFDLLCRVVMSEAGSESIQCQIAVAETILNRLVMGGYGDSISEVVYKPYQYSIADNGEPTECVLQAVTNALEMQIYPLDMVYFRAEHYHEFGEPYKKIDNTYFSLAEQDV